MRATPSLVALSQLLLSIGFLDSVSAQVCGNSTGAAASATSATSTTTISPQLATEIANLENYFAYGGSPEVAPPIAAGVGDWAQAYTKAKALVAQMTNEEKELLTIGYTTNSTGCSGTSGNVTRLGYPGMCLSDAGEGLRATEGTSGFPSGVHVGASWNKALAKARAQYMGQEFKSKGVTVALGPVVGPLGRVALGGRNWEGFGADPYLSGSLTYDTVQGMQESIIACTKHFIGYEQETNRFPTPDGLNASISSNIDDKTMHELYLWPFVDAVKAGTGSVMCSYNRINGSYASQNSKAMNGLLKSELEFQGFVVSDWNAQHTGIASAIAGLDMAMPRSQYWSGNLTTAVNNGTLSQERLDDMVTRILAAFYKIDPEMNPGHSLPVNLSLPHTFINARNPASKQTIFQGAVEGHVLVKNEGALPLKAPALLSIFGYDAIVPSVNDIDNASLNKWALADESVDLPDSVLSATLHNLPGWTNNSNTPSAALQGTIISGGGSGAVTSPYISAPFDALQQQAYNDNTYLFWDFVNVDPLVDPASDACLVFINEFASEGYDRHTLSDPFSDQLVQNVASQCNNTIVSIHNAGIRIVDAWVDHPNVTAVIYSHLPGQDSGRALVELLYGRQSPSGRMPYTVARKASDYGALLEPEDPSATSDYYTQSNFTEGVYIDYRSFIARNVTPRYEFGYGLTYSNFSYSSLNVDTYANASHALVPANTTASVGGPASLWDTLATVTAKIQNTGHVAAAEVAQLYLGIPNSPQRQLRGFAKETLAPGASCTVSFDLTRRDLSVWDVVSQEWTLQKGSYTVEVGKSVLDIQLTGSITI